MTQKEYLKMIDDTIAKIDDMSYKIDFLSDAINKVTPYATDDLKTAFKTCNMICKVSTLRFKNVNLLINLSDYYTCLLYGDNIK